MIGGRRGARHARGTGAPEGAYNLRHTNKVSSLPPEVFRRLKAAPVVFLVGVFGDDDFEVYENLPQAMAAKERLAKGGGAVFLSRHVQGGPHAER